MVVGHVSPEAYEGGTIALVKERDSITISAEKRLIQLNVPAREIAARRAKWKQPAPRYTKGLLAKYMRLVSTASIGAITDGAAATPAKKARAAKPASSAKAVKRATPAAASRKAPAAKPLRSVKKKVKAVKKAGPAAAGKKKK